MHFVEAVTFREYLLSDNRKYLTSDSMSWLIVGRDFARRQTSAPCSKQEKK